MSNIFSKTLPHVVFLLVLSIAIHWSESLGASAAHLVQSPIDQRIQELKTTRQRDNEHLLQLSDAEQRTKLVSTKVITLQSQYNREHREAKWAAIRALFGVGIGALSVIVLQKQFTNSSPLSDARHTAKTDSDASGNSLYNAMQRYSLGIIGCITSLATFGANTAQCIYHTRRQHSLSALIAQLRQFQKHQLDNPYEFVKAAQELGLKAPDWNKHKTNYITLMLLKHVQNRMKTPITIEQLISVVNQQLGNPWSHIELAYFRTTVLKNQTHADNQILCQALRDNQQLQEQQQVHTQEQEEIPQSTEENALQEVDASVLSVYGFLARPRNDQNQTEPQSEEVVSPFSGIANAYAKSAEHNGDVQEQRTYDHCPTDSPALSDSYPQSAQRTSAFNVAEIGLIAALQGRRSQS